MRRAQFREPRSVVLSRLRDAGASDPAATFASLALLPRTKWDEPNPPGAKQRDWYPWRYGRRLSVVRKPLIQLSVGDDPDVLVAPTLIDTTLRYLCEIASGNLPVDLFESKGMRSYIGAVADKVGHRFNGTVADALEGLGWHTRRELKLTEVGGLQALGDVDVLAWDEVTCVVYALECKRLQFARTIGEIGERLNEYASITTSGKRTPIQKHLDRMAFLEGHKAALSRIVRIPPEKIVLRSGLVTDYLVPMQFSKNALDMVDVVTDVTLLEKAFGRTGLRE